MTILIIAVEALLIVAHLAMPFAHKLSLERRATDIVADLNTVRAAAEASRSTSGTWPADAARGEVPASLKELLPPGFSFARPGYELDWEEWPVSDPSAIAPTRRDVAGVSVVTQEPALAAAVARALPEGEMRVTLGNRTTLVFIEAALTP